MQLPVWLIPFLLTLGVACVAIGVIVARPVPSRAWAGAGLAFVAVTAILLLLAATTT